MNETYTGEKKLLSINEMWQVVNGVDYNWGVEGYEAPRRYADAKQTKWEREREKIMKENEGKWPPSDWPKVKKPGEIVTVPPKRPNYLDQLYKWSNSFYDEEKAKTIKEELNGKNRPIDAPKPPPENDKKKRTQFLENEEEIRKRRAENSDYPKYDEKIAWIEKAKDKIKSSNEKNNKDKITLVKEKYAKFGSLPKCDRITVVSDALYCGEKVPFYNTIRKEEDNEEEASVDEDGKKKKKKEKPLFFPSKTCTYNSAPKWSYPKKKTEMKQQNGDEKTEGDEDKKKFEPIDIRKSFYNMTNHGHLRSDQTRVNYFFCKPSDLDSIEQYKAWKENNPKNNPGPQHYWKWLPYSSVKKNKKAEEEQLEGDPKVYRMNREKTDKRIYKPMKSHIF